MGVDLNATPVFEDEVDASERCPTAPVVNVWKPGGQTMPVDAQLGFSRI
jgi:hypothetical protein